MDHLYEYEEFINLNEGSLEDKINALKSKSSDNRWNTADLQTNSFFKFKYSEGLSLLKKLNKDLNKRFNIQGPDAYHAHYLWEFNSTIQEVSIDEILPTQPTVGREVLLKKVNGDTTSTTAIPRLIKTNKGYLIVNGHHRIVLEILQGNRVVECQVVVFSNFYSEGILKK